MTGVAEGENRIVIGVACHSNRARVSRAVEAESGS